jgi:glutamyl-tRNA reductase
LIGLGSRSYGSAVRRYVGNAPRIALAGTGMLANDVLPFLIRSDRQLDLWGRRDAIDGVDPTVIYRRYDAEMTPVDEPAILVIAAPLSSADITRLAARYRALTLIVDLRAEGVEDPPPPVAPLLTLADVFAGVQEASRAVEARVAAAKDAIRQLARGYVTRAKLNPSGWHDLCA